MCVYVYVNKNVGWVTNLGDFNIKLTHGVITYLNHIFQRQLKQSFKLHKQSARCWTSGIKDVAGSD